MSNKLSLYANHNQGDHASIGWRKLESLAVGRTRHNCVLAQRFGSHSGSLNRDHSFSMWNPPCLMYWDRKYMVDTTHQRLRLASLRRGGSRAHTLCHGLGELLDHRQSRREPGAWMRIESTRWCDSNPTRHSNVMSVKKKIN